MNNRTHLTGGSKHEALIKGYKEEIKGYQLALEQAKTGENRSKRKVRFYRQEIDRCKDKIQEHRQQLSD
jgi:hypothetical protein